MEEFNKALSDEGSLDVTIRRKSENGLWEKYAI
jgi:hypothetical protein